jgi:CheY-like chemotaxis protein
MSKILIADDDPFLIQIYSTRLAKDDHQVIACNDGQEAIEKILETKPDLIVLDIMLPKLNGLDILSSVRENKQFSKTPIVILSNLTHPQEQEEAKRRGATEFLSKIQYTPSQVITELQKHLPKK